MNYDNNFNSNNLQENTEFSLADIKEFITEVLSSNLSDDKKAECKKYLEDLNKKIDATNKHIASDKQARNNLYQRIANRSKDLEMLEMYKHIIEREL